MPRLHRRTTINIQSPSAEGLSRTVVAVIPCYNAGDRVRQTVLGVLRHVSRVIVVDDGCTDASMDGLRDLPVQILRFDRNRGKGHALLAGLREALRLPEVSAVALLDADGQHAPDELPGLYACFEREHADLLIGARSFDARSVPWRSRFGNKVTVRVASRVFGVHLPDTQCGYRLLSPAFARAFLEQIPGGRYETETRMLLLAARGGFKLVSAPIATLYEVGNKSSHFRKIRDSWRIYVALVGALLRPGDTGRA